jgi:EAL domain
MSVNVSARQFQHPDFMTQLERALRESGFPPQCLTLELTESVLLTSGSLLEQRLSMLKEIGVTLALDDFGTGYASLSYLQRFPVDVVKIDRSFIAEIDGASTDLVLLKGIIDLSRVSASTPSWRVSRPGSSTTSSGPSVATVPRASTSGIPRRLRSLTPHLHADDGTPAFAQSA